MNAGDIMVRPAIAVREDQPLAEAVRLMVDHRISGLPVVDDADHPVGMLTEGDLLRRIEAGTDKADATWLDAFFTDSRLARHYIRTHGRHVSQVMTRNVISAEASTPLDKVVVLMRRNRIKRLPVTRDGKLVGIVSRFDLLRLVADRLNAPSEAVDDATIAAAIRNAIADQQWALGPAPNVTVADGVVRLDGHAYEMAVLEAMTVLAESMPGVTRVDNRMICIDRTTGIVCWNPDVDGKTAQPADAAS